MMALLHLTTLLCLALVGNVKGQSIMCHSCYKFSNVTDCDLQPPQDCGDETPCCKIVQEKTGIPGMEMFDKVTTTKGCASEADCSGEVGAFQHPKYIWCCQGDLCNTFKNMGKDGFRSFNSHA